MTPAHVWGLERAMTPTSWQCWSGKHRTSGRGRVYDVHHRMAIMLRAHSQPWSRRLTDRAGRTLGISCSNPLILESQGLEKGSDSPRTTQLQAEGLSAGRIVP